MTCTYELAWIGNCKQSLPCPFHHNIKCIVCGNEATHECPETDFGVCSKPLCKSCYHVRNGYSSYHKKSKI